MDALKTITDPISAAVEQGVKLTDPISAAVTSTAGGAISAADKYGKAGIGLVLAGVDKTFEVSGVASGFQAVMAGFGNVDTSDEGLETLFREIDADGSGSISEQEMAKAIDKLYGEPLKPQLVAQMMKAADTNNDGQIQLEEFKSIMRAGPPKAPSTSPPVLKPKHIMDVSGDTPEGKPDYAIAYVAEGASLFGTQYSAEKFLLSPALQARGLSGADWARICYSLRQGKGQFGIGSGFSKAVAKANEEYFDRIGCVGVYAEYGAGQKAMVVLTKEVANSGRVTWPTT